MRDEKEIDAEIERLKSQLPRVRARSSFGDNHRDAIEAQIRVLSKRMPDDEVWDQYSGEEDDEDYSQRVFDAAVDASRWLRGEWESLADEWEPLCESGE